MRIVEPGNILRRPEAIFCKKCKGQLLYCICCVTDWDDPKGFPGSRLGAVGKTMFQSIHTCIDGGDHEANEG